MVLNFHYLFGRYVHHISAGNNFSVTLRHNGLHQNWGRKYFFQNGVKRICFYLSPTFISNSSMFIHATCCHVWTSWSLVVACFCISAGKNVVFFSISAGNNVVFAPFTKHNTKYSLNSGDIYILGIPFVLVRIACPKKDDTVLFLSGAFLLCNQLIKAPMESCTLKTQKISFTDLFAICPCGDQLNTNCWRITWTQRFSKDILSPHFIWTQLIFLGCWQSFGFCHPHMRRFHHRLSQISVVD